MIHRIGFREEVVPERSSYDAACQVIDVILQTKAGKLPMRAGAARLREALGDHMAKHIAAYGEGLLRPKHHWMFDVAEQFLRDACVLDAFVVERLHLRAKEAADPVHNLAVFERSVLSRMLNSQLQAPIARGGDRLIGVVTALPDMPATRVANSLECSSVVFAVDDVVCNADAFGVVIACALEEGSLLLVLEELRVAAAPLVRKAGVLVVWRPDQCELATAWQWRGANLCEFVR